MVEQGVGRRIESVFIIANPSTGRGDREEYRERIDTFEDWLYKNAEYDVRFERSKSSEHLRELARLANKENQVVGVIGGDGSINGVASELVRFDQSTESRGPY